MEAVVLDNGSTLLRAGFAGEDDPVATLPVLVGRESEAARARAQVGLSTLRRKGTERASILAAGGIGEAPRGRGGDYVGRQAQAHAALLELRRPVQRGAIADWDAMQTLWEYVFEHELRVEAEEAPVLVSDTPLSSKAAREQTAQVMFEALRVPGCYMANEAVLSLFATGRTRGTVLSLGGEVCSVVPVFEGFALPHATRRLELGGEDLTSLLQSKLPGELPRSVVADIKEAICTVGPKRPRASQQQQQQQQRRSSLDRTSSVARAAAAAATASFKQADPAQYSGAAVDPRVEQTAEPGAVLLPPHAVVYELPDGQVIEVKGETRAIVPEALFDPSVLALLKQPRGGASSAGPGTNGIAALLAQCLQACDKTLQADLHANVVLAGGSSLFPGLAARLSNELLELSPLAKITVVQDSQRKAAAWIGGSMLASLDTFPQIMVSRAEWEECGIRAVHHKCL
jgi:actin